MINQEKVMISSSLDAAYHNQYTQLEDGDNEDNKSNNKHNMLANPKARINIALFCFGIFLLALISSIKTPVASTDKSMDLPFVAITNEINIEEETLVGVDVVIKLATNDNGSTDLTKFHQTSRLGHASFSQEMSFLFATEFYNSIVLQNILKEVGSFSNITTSIRLGGNSQDQMDIDWNGDDSKSHKAEELDAFMDFIKKIGFNIVWGLKFVNRCGCGGPVNIMKNVMPFVQHFYEKDYNQVVGYELGNEPDGCHPGDGSAKGNISIASHAKDVEMLRNIIDYMYGDVASNNKNKIKPMIIGPDSTHGPSYIDAFLGNLSHPEKVMDVVTSHIYFGPPDKDSNVTKDLTNPRYLAYMNGSVKTHMDLMKKYDIQNDVDFMVGEGASCYWGGCKQSNRFGGMFSDIKGLSDLAFNGGKGWFRQSLIGSGDGYGLIVNTRNPETNKLEFIPTPSFWIILMMKKLFGDRIILDIDSKTVNPDANYVHKGYYPYVHSYVYCSSHHFQEGSISMAIINLQNETRTVYVENNDLGNTRFEGYFTTPDYKNMSSRDVLLNDVPLNVNQTTGKIPDIFQILQQVDTSSHTTTDSIVSLPPKSVLFLVFPETRFQACL